MSVQSVTLEGKRFVIVAEDEYKRIRDLAHKTSEETLPEFPAPDAKGRYPAKETIDVSIAREVIQRRTAVGLTRSELASLASVRLSTIEGIETVEKMPSVATIEKIDRALKKAERKRKTA